MRESQELRQHISCRDFAFRKQSTAVAVEVVVYHPCPLFKPNAPYFVNERWEIDGILYPYSESDGVYFFDQLRKVLIPDDLVPLVPAEDRILVSEQVITCAEDAFVKEFVLTEKSSGLPVVGVPVRIMLYFEIRPSRCRALDCAVWGFLILLDSSHTMMSGLHFDTSFSSRQQLS